MQTEDTHQLLQQRWLHSHEEDTATETVYRPASFAFPRSRGRAGFELRPNHELVEIGIAPTDGPQLKQGVWELNENSDLILHSGTLPRTLHIHSATPECLVIQK